MTSHNLLWKKTPKGLESFEDNNNSLERFIPKKGLDRFLDRKDTRVMFIELTVKYDAKKKGGSLKWVLDLKSSFRQSFPETHVWHAVHVLDVTLFKCKWTVYTDYWPHVYKSSQPTVTVYIYFLITTLPSHSYSV